MFVCVYICVLVELAGQVGLEVISVEGQCLTEALPTLLGGARDEVLDFVISFYLTRPCLTDICLTNCLLCIPICYLHYHYRKPKLGSISALH